MHPCALMHRATNLIHQRCHGRIHQSPDSVNSALLPTIPQVQMDLAITINATGLQPELFDLSRQSQIYLVALRIRLLNQA